MQRTATTLILIALCVVLPETVAPAQSKAPPPIPGTGKLLGDEIRSRRELEEAYLSLALAATGGEGTSLVLAEAVNAETTHPRSPRLGSLFGNAPAIRAIPLRGAPATIRIGETDWTPLGAIHPGWAASATPEGAADIPAGLYLVARSGARAALLHLTPDERGLPSWSMEARLDRCEITDRTTGPAAAATFPGGNNHARVVLRTERATVTLDLALEMLLL